MQHRHGPARVRWYEPAANVHAPVFALEVEAYAQLNASRIEGGCETQRFAWTSILSPTNIERRRHHSHRVVHAAVVKSVEHVETFANQFETNAVVEPQSSRQSDIYGPEVRSSAGVSAGAGRAIRCGVQVRVDVRVGQKIEWPPTVETQNRSDDGIRQQPGDCAVPSSRAGVDEGP